MKKKKTIIRKRAKKTTPKPVRKPPVLWVTASGATIRPADMGDDHLTNTVSMLRRRHAHDLNLLRLVGACNQTPELGMAIGELLVRFGSAASLHPAYLALERELNDRVEDEDCRDTDCCPF